MTTPVSLPGITFEVVPRALDDALPRMDVCGFVGFATRGPIDVPVVVDDAVAFRDVFGADPVLARTDDGLDVPGLLGPAVVAFFANGGRRAWVVRVAAVGEGGAATNRFGVPRLVTPGSPAGAGDGGWVLASMPARCPGSWSDHLTVGATLEVLSLRATILDHGRVLAGQGSEIEVGDLVRIPVDATTHAVVAATSIEATGAGTIIGFDPTAGWRFTDGTAATGPAHVLTPDGAAPLVTLTLTSAVTELVIEVDTAEEISAGALVVLEPVGPGESDTFVVLGDEAFDGIPVGTRRFATERIVTVEPLASDWAAALPNLDAERIIERQRVRITVSGGVAVEGELAGLGLAADHRRAIQRLPDDDALYLLLAGVPRSRPGDELSIDDFVERDLSPVERETMAPRFPLAGVSASFVLPIALTTDPTAAIDSDAPSAADPDTRPARDGLASFDPSMFIDPALAGLGSDTLMPTAWDLAYVQQPPHRLRGIHALATNDDVTLLCVPDAVHTGWDQMTIPPPPPLTPPEPSIVGVDAESVDLVWTAVETATGYEVEHGPDIEWNAPRRVTAESTSMTIGGWSRCPEVEYFRVRAVRGSEVGPWSQVVGAAVPASVFGTCATIEVVGDGAEPVADPVPDLVVWRSRRPEEAAPWAELRAIQTAALRFGEARGDVMAVLAMPQSFRAGDAVRHVEALRFGSPDDPSPFLPGGVLTMGPDEASLLGYGALYHPWLVTASEIDGSIAEITPDGAAAGTIAARSLARGAWVAPARIPLADVVALAPTIDADHLPTLVGASVDAIVDDPSGFMAVAANTMSTTALTRPINVRRLVMLLRRLAQREGAGIVFEPNDHELRRLVAMRFDRFLTAMFQRGAFAGGVPSEAFEVSTGENVNPPAAVEAGRFVVEVRFAPSRPLEYLTVRLVMAGGARPEERT